MFTKVGKKIGVWAVALLMGGASAYAFQGYADQYRETGSFQAVSCVTPDNFMPFTTGDQANDATLMRAVFATPNKSIDLEEVLSDGVLDLESDPIKNESSADVSDWRLNISPTGRLTLAENSATARVYGEATITRPEGSSERGAYLTTLRYTNKEGKAQGKDMQVVALYSPDKLASHILVELPANPESIEGVRAVDLTPICIGD